MAHNCVEHLAAPGWDDMTRTERVKALEKNFIFYQFNVTAHAKQVSVVVIIYRGEDKTHAIELLDQNIIGGANISKGRRIAAAEYTSDKIMADMIIFRCADCEVRQLASKIYEQRFGSAEIKKVA